MITHFWIGASKGRSVVACGALNNSANMDPAFITCEKCKQQNIYFYSCIAMDNTDPAEFQGNITTWAIKVRSAVHHRMDVTVDLTRKPPVVLERKGS